jgi:hypothetical protein
MTDIKTASYMRAKQEFEKSMLEERKAYEGYKDLQR